MRPIPIWLRALFLINVVLLAPQGIGLFSPGNIPFPVTVSPLNARFIGALYLAAAVGMILSALGQDLADIRIFLFGFAIISILVLIVTFAYWGDFAATRVPVIWLVTYVVDPVAAMAALLMLRPLRAAQPGTHQLSMLFVLESGLFGVVGILLLLAPGIAMLIWPWNITPLLSQVYGAFILSFAVGALLAVWESRPAAVLPIAASTAVLAALTLIASSLHLDRFAPGLASWIWFGVLAATLAAAAVALVWLLRPTIQSTLLPR
jgi:hypothetical protein